MAGKLYNPHVWQGFNSLTGSHFKLPLRHSLSRVVTAPVDYGAQLQKRKNQHRNWR